MLVYQRVSSILSYHIHAPKESTQHWRPCAREAQTLAPGYRADIQPPPFAAQVVAGVVAGTMYRMICCVGCRLRSFLGLLIVTFVTFQKFTACDECLVLVGQKAWCWSLRLCGVQKWCIPRNGNFNIGKDWYGKGVIINKWVLGYPRFSSMFIIVHLLSDRSTLSISKVGTHQLIAGFLNHSL